MTVISLSTIEDCELHMCPLFHLLMQLNPIHCTYTCRPWTHFFFYIVVPCRMEKYMFGAPM